MRQAKSRNVRRAKLIPRDKQEQEREMIGKYEPEAGGRTAKDCGPGRQKWMGRRVGGQDIRICEIVLGGMAREE